MDKVILYTIHCPQCTVLEKKLQQKGIEFDIVDDKEEILKKSSEVGIKSAPFLKVGDTYYKFNDAVKWVGNYGN